MNNSFGKLALAVPVRSPLDVTTSDIGPIGKAATATSPWANLH